ncbi:hypothetical protein LTR86_005213 [Recurvomyces mirabilis]|nr:hypothetical protein LTR86_005213 [Recurvomyces mirabilis]
MHLNSKIHRGSNIICPFCKVGHTIASGLCHHLETGSCPNATGLNHDTITRIIRERDPNSITTNKQLTYYQTTYEVNDNTWNGRSWECYLCHRTFVKHSGLNQHLNSAVHKQKVYHCPNRGCRKDFVSLAALFNHLESESCSFMRFETVQKHVGQVLTGNRLIAFG